MISDEFARLDMENVVASFRRQARIEFRSVRLPGTDWYQGAAHMLRAAEYRALARKFAGELG